MTVPQLRRDVESLATNCELYNNSGAKEDEALIEGARALVREVLAMVDALFGPAAARDEAAA